MPLSNWIGRSKGSHATKNILIIFLFLQNFIIYYSPIGVYVCATHLGHDSLFTTNKVLLEQLSMILPKLTPHNCENMGPHAMARHKPLLDELHHYYQCKRNLLEIDSINLWLSHLMLVSLD